MPGVVVLRSGGVKGLVRLFVVRFLEDLESADTNLAQKTQIVHGKRCGIHVHTANAHGRASLRSLHLSGIARTDCLGDILGGGVGMLSVHCDETLVPNTAGKDVHLLLQFIHRQHATLLKVISFTKAAVLAAVHAEIGHVQRREHHDAVVVNLSLDPVGSSAHLLKEVFVRHAHESGRIRNIKRFARRFRLRYYLAYANRVHFFGIGFRERTIDQILVYEVLAAGKISVNLALDDKILRIVGGILEPPYVVCIGHRRCYL